MFLDGGQQLLVHLGLIGLPLVGGFVLLLLGLEDVALLLGRLLVALGPAEVLVVQLLGHLHARNVHRRRSGQQKALVHATQRTPVDLEGT